MLSSPRLDSRFRLTPEQAQSLERAYGTPLYVIDESHFRARIRRYRAAFEAAHAKTEIVFASKANSTLALLRIAYEEGCLIDVASEGELRAALRAGVPAERCHFHGNNKAESEIRFALESRVGQIVVDHFGEIELLSRLLSELPHPELKVVLRLAPGVDPITHAKISTGQADTKFGFNITDGSAERATLRALELGLPLVGFHCHVGSQLLDPEAQRSGGELIARFASEMKRRHGFEASLLNVGGGLGVKYLEGDEPMDVEPYSKLVAEAIMGGLEGTGLNPTLAQEPGRSLVAESGVTLYKVGVVKTVPAKERGTRTYVCVDGGLSDNPRPALYSAKYQVLPIRNSEGSSPNQVTISGKHCETDKLFEDVLLPADVAPGDLLQVLTTGAYNSSMASNYNRFPRPATALIRPDGSHTLIQRRETWDEMMAREILPEDL